MKIQNSIHKIIMRVTIKPSRKLTFIQSTENDGIGSNENDTKSNSINWNLMILMIIISHKDSNK